MGLVNMAGSVQAPQVNQKQPSQPQAQGNGETPWYLSRDTYNSGDGDLIHAAILSRYVNGESGFKRDARAFAGSANVDVARSAINSLLARSNQRKGLNAAINAAPGELSKEEDILKSTADQALNQGLSGTRKNFNRRGLLFSGMREGGEQSVRNSVGNALQSSLQGARQSSNDLTNKRKAAVASLGLQAEKESLAAAEQQFQVNLQSSVARTQALQQLGGALGQIGGMAYGSREQTPEPTPSTGGYSSSTNPYGRQSRISAGVGD